MIVYISAAVEPADSGKYSFGLLNLNSLAIDLSLTIPGRGKRDFSDFFFTIDSIGFINYLGPGGVFINVKASSLTGSGLHVDRFFVAYSITNPYANNVLKSIFFKGSDTQSA